MINFSTLIFYLFSIVLVSSSIIAVGARNTVHSVLFLILAFFNAAGLFILLKAEFLAMLLVVVYVGAIAVLFLFIVMMLDIDQKQTKAKLRKNLPLLLFFSILFLTELLVVIKFTSSNLNDVKIIRLFPNSNLTSNTKALGDILYTSFVLPFQIAGAILFVAMIGAIVLTLKEKNKLIKSQIISKQILREKTVTLVNPRFHEGIDV